MGESEQNDLVSYVTFCEPTRLSNAIFCLVRDQNPQILLDSHRYKYAALAYFGYEQKGRGMLVIPGLQVAGTSAYVEMFFLTAKEINQLPPAVLSLEGRFDCLQVIAKYEPTKEVTICFVFAGSYKLVRSTDINPIDALLNQKHSFEEDFRSGNGTLVMSTDDETSFFTNGTPGRWEHRGFPIKM